MRVIFSSLFRADLTEAKGRYEAISARLADDLETRVRDTVRTIVR